MIRGEVTPDLEALIPLGLQSAAGAELPITALLDTGFTGYLTIPPDVVQALALPFYDETEATLADGSTVTLREFEGRVYWNSVVREVLVLETAGVPLAGMALLYGSRLFVDVVDGGLVQIEARGS